MTKKYAPVILFALACAVGAFGQTSTSPTNPLQAPAAAAAPTASFLSQLADPSTIGMGAYIFAQIAQSVTSYTVVLGGHNYTFSGPEVTAWTAGSVVGLAAVMHKWPKTKTGITIGLGVVSAMLAGKAYYNSLNHGTVTSSTATASPAFRAQFRFGR